MAWNAHSAFSSPNSEFSKGVRSINQPIPLALRSMRIVPWLGLPSALKLVIVASASCPAGRSVILYVMSISVCGKRVDQRLVTLLLS